LYTAFPEDADEEYITQSDVILQTLGLTEIRKEELKLLAQRKKQAAAMLIAEVCNAVIG